MTRNTFKNDNYKAMLTRIFADGKNRNKTVNVNGFKFRYGTFDNVCRVIDDERGFALPVFSFCFGNFMWLF